MTRLLEDYCLISGNGAKNLFMIENYKIMFFDMYVILKIYIRSNSLQVHRSYK